MGWIARIVLVLPFWLVISLLFVTAGGTENVVLFYPITFGLTLLAIYLFTSGKTKEFKIYSNGFSVDGRRYDFGGVKEIFLDNPADKSGPVTSKPIGFIDGGSGVLGTMAASAAVSSAALVGSVTALQGAAYEGNIARRFRVGFRCGAKNACLVRNVRLGVAESIFDYLTKKN
ncbi:hypothetical protein VB636_08665 [Paracoccus sp. APAP_BH8]